MFIIVLGQHVSILIEPSSGPSNKTDRYLAIFKMRCGIPNTYILDITMYKMHVLLCYDCTIRILISKTLTGTYEGSYTYVFEICCYTTLDIMFRYFNYTNQCTCIKFHIRTLKIVPTCFDPKIILREPCCSLLKSRTENNH